MSFIFLNALFTLALAGGMLVSIAVGRRRGARRMAADPEHGRSGLGVIDASVFALLGLVLAFTFNGAGQRFIERRTHMGAELVVIEEGWRKIDLLPVPTQPGLRDLFRRYLDERIAAYRTSPDAGRVAAHTAAADALRKEIWQEVVAATATPEGAPARLQMSTAVDHIMESYVRSRVLMVQHPPPIVYVVMALLMLVTALFMGEGMAESRRLSRTHTVGLVVILAGLSFVIMDLEHPLGGLIHLDRTIQELVDLRSSFGP